MRFLIPILFVTGCFVSVDMRKKFEINETPFGMCSNPNVLKAPLGALRLADNCIIRRTGVVEPKTGVDKVSMSGSGLSYVNRMYNFDDDLLLYDSKSTDLFEFLGNLGNELQDEDSGHPTFFTNYMNVFNTSGNLYVACQDGVRKVTSSDSTDLFRAGITNDSHIYAVTEYYDPGMNKWWASGTYISYRTVHKRIFNDGSFIDSIPSHSYTDGASSESVPMVTIHIGPDVIVGDIIQLFRTPAVASGSPIYFTSNDYYLAAEHIVTSSDISTGYFQHFDLTPEDDLGEELYTNASQSGSESSNFRPPVAKVLARHKNSFIYANIIEPTRVFINIRNYYSDLTGSTYGAGVRYASGTISAGSAFITSISTSMLGIQVGQLIEGTGIPTDTYVIDVSVGSAWIEMSKDATASTTTSFAISDTITFGYGSTYETYKLAYHVGTSTYHSAHNLRVNMIANDSEYRLDILSGFNGLEDGIMEAVIERRVLNSSVFYVWGTHGQDADTSYKPLLSPPTWVPNEFVFDTSNGVPATKTISPNVYYYSKINQPEHVPLGNHDYIGDSSAIIQWLETIDGSIVFKDDGIYLITGDAVSGFEERQIDRENILVTSNAAVSVENAVYALTNNGFVRVTAYGVEYISKQYLDFRAAEGTQASQTGSLIRLLSSILQNRRDGYDQSGCFVSYDKRGSQIYFTIPFWGDEAHYVYVYNLVTGAFTRWNYNDSKVFFIVSHAGDINTLYVAGQNIGESGILYKDNSIYGGNYTRIRTIESKPDATTVNFTAAHNASAGDIITDGRYRGIISAVIDADSVTVDTNEGLTGSVTIYTPFPITIRWMPKFGDTRSSRKHFLAYGFMFDSIGELASSKGVLESYAVSFMGEDYPHFGGSYDATYYEDKSVNGTTVRGYIPVAYARKFILEPAIRIEAVNVLWSLVGVSLEYILQEPRGVKK